MPEWRVSAAAHCVCTARILSDVFFPVAWSRLILFFTVPKIPSALLSPAGTVKLPLLGKSLRPLAPLT